MNYIPSKSLIILAVAAWLVGCSSSGVETPTPSPSSTPSFVSAEVLPPQGPEELIRVSGIGAPYVSPPLRLTSEATLRASWEQSSAGEFGFSVARSEEAGEEITFELILGPSSGSGEDTFSPGDYVIKVTAADGPWLIWVETVKE